MLFKTENNDLRTTCGLLNGVILGSALWALFAAIGLVIFLWYPSHPCLTL